MCCCTKALGFDLANAEGNTSSAESYFRSYWNHYLTSYKKEFENIEIDYYKNFIDVDKIEVLKELYNIKIAASVVEKYMPSSIDYFMTNLEDVASEEFKDIKNDKDKIKNRKDLIHKYTKFIINDILIKAQNEIINDKKGKRSERHYLFNIKDRILKNSAYHGHNFTEYAKSHIDVFNFNYDKTFDELFEDFVPGFKNIIHIYGEITDDREFDLFKYIFERKDMGEINKTLRWIDEDTLEPLEDSKATIAQKIHQATEIYFLGFGFDEKNLLNLGIINERKELTSMEYKRMFIAPANGRIINLIEDLFCLERGQIVSKNVFASSRYLDSCFDDF